jgi:hypothetical protein
MQRTISWDNPTAYTDGTAIGAEKSRLKIHVWKDGQEVYVTLPAVSQWPIEVIPGQTNQWELTAELDGQVSPKSAPFSYTEPFQIPGIPGKVKVS